MADNKTLYARVQAKYDTYSNWNTANPVLLEGETAVVIVPSGTGLVAQEPAVMFKVGDGSTSFRDLAFASATAADVYDWAKAEEKPSYTASELGLTDTLYRITQDTTNQYIFYLYVSEDDGETWVLQNTVEIPQDASTLVTGETNGTVSYNGTEVAVAGLGTAAYTDSTAYDAAGAADTVSQELTDRVDELEESLAVVATTGDIADLVQTDDEYVIIGGGSSTIWTGGKDKATISLSASTLTVEVGASNSVTVTTNSSGTLSATTTNSGVATVSISGTTATITGVAIGTATVTVGVGEDSTYAANSASVSVTVKAATVTISTTPSQSGTLTYTGSTLTPSWNNYSTTQLTIGGTTSATNAGTYTATFTPNDGYEWSDGTTTAKSVAWTIDRATISTTPSTSSSLTYTGSSQSPTWSNYSSTQLTIGGDTAGTSAGTYTTTFTPKANYQWSDGTYTAKSVSWTIARATISTYPSVTGTLTYTGSVQTPTWTNYDSSKMTIGGTVSATDAGTYTATFTPTDNYQWANGTYTAYSVSWSIGKAAGGVTLSATSLTISLADTTTASFTVSRSGDGRIQADTNDSTVATASVSGTTVTVTGLSEGQTTITVSVAEGTNYTAPADATCLVTVEAAVITLTAVPSQSGSLTYTGSAQSPTWSNYDSSQLTIGGTYSATTAGTYTATFTPKSGYVWSDGTSTAKSVSWTIAKAEGSLSLSSTSVSLDNDTTSTTVTANRSGDGTVNATSSDAGVATVSVSGNVITITGVASGSATVTVSVAEGTNYTAPADATCLVTVSMASGIGTLEETEWSVISEVSTAGTGANYWAVGDTKSVAISGTVGTLSVDETLYVYILGFDHNSDLEGKGISFGGFKTSDGIDVCLVDSYYLSYATDGTKYFNVNHSGNYNYGGWAACDMRYDILGSTDTAPQNYGSAHSSGDVGYDASSTCATSPVSGTLMAALPSALRAVMTPITKYTDNVGAATNTAACISATVDYLPLLAEYEVQGASTYANSYEYTYQAQYDYYAAGNSKIKYRHSSTGSTASWRLRSPYYSYSTYFCYVSTSGSANFITARYSFGVAPAFKI